MPRVRGKKSEKQGGDHAIQIEKIGCCPLLPIVLESLRPKISRIHACRRLNRTIEDIRT